MTLVVVTPPAPGGLVSLEAAKAQCRVEADDDDVLISALIAAASATIEAETHRRFLAQSIDWINDCWPSGRPFPLAGFAPGAMTLAGVSYADGSGEMQTLDPQLYWSRSAGESLQLAPRRFAVWPILGDAADRVVLHLDFAGELDNVPAPAEHACKLLVAHLWRNREAVVGVESRDSSTALPLGVESLLTQMRWS